MEAKFLAPEEGEYIEIAGAHYYFKLRGEENADGNCIFEAVVPPGASPPLHYHKQVDEFIIPIDGELTIRVGEEIKVIGPGGLAIMPKGIPHNFGNLTDKPVRAYGIFTRGSIDRYFYEMAAIMANSKGGPPPTEAIAALGDKYDFVVLGPPMKKVEA